MLLFTDAMTTKAEREAEMLVAAEVQALKSITGASDDQLVEIRPESVTAYEDDANIGKVLELHYYLRYWNGVAACFIQVGLMVFNARTEDESVVWWPNVPAIFQQDPEPTVFETKLAAGIANLLSQDENVAMVIQRIDVDDEYAYGWLFVLNASNQVEAHHKFAYMDGTTIRMRDYVGEV